MPDTVTVSECAQCGHPLYAKRQHVCAVDCGIGVGENVSIKADSSAFEYGGFAPFGGHIVAVHPGEVDVCFYTPDEDGEEWAWTTWSFPIEDVALMVASGSLIDESERPDGE